MFPTHEWPFKIVGDLFANNFSEVKKKLLKECGRNLFNFFKNRLAFSYQRHLNSTLTGMEAHTRQVIFSHVQYTRLRDSTRSKFSIP